MVKGIPALQLIRKTKTSSWEFAAVYLSDEGLVDYLCQLLPDLDFSAFSHSALVAAGRRTKCACRCTCCICLLRSPCVPEWRSTPDWRSRWTLAN